MIEDDIEAMIGFVDRSDETTKKLIAEVRRLRTTIKLQANAARMGMDAAKSASTIQLQLAEQARADSSPEVLQSERKVNAILTEENEALRVDAERYRYLRHVNRRECLKKNGPAAGCWIDSENERGVLVLLTEEDADAVIDVARAKEPA